MLAMEADTALDLQVLEQLDFKIPCGHTLHGKEMGTQHSRHGGDATHWCKVLHECPADPGCAGSVYPGCANWIEYVTSMQDQWWVCPLCKSVMPGDTMVIVLGPLE